MDLEKLHSQYTAALRARSDWERAWDECAKFAAPAAYGRQSEVFDSTAALAVDNLASSLLSQLTPPWSRWFGLSGALAESAPAIEDVERAVASHFERSNFYVEAHQCYLDLATFGTAAMMFEEESIGAQSAFRFTAIPLREIALCADKGFEGGAFRATKTPISALSSKFPEAEFSPLELEKMAREPDAEIKVIESVLPRGERGFSYTAYAYDEDGIFGGRTSVPLREGTFPTSPFIIFRWMKTPGEIYGISPVMKALPDIKTANRAVELLLKNASIAVAGVWQADDDGVINLENITLEPGAIIAKAVGSSGLTPLRSGANFDVSQLVLADLRANINRALLADRLSFVGSGHMTATEVMERADETGRILGATYGRLQSEFISPLVLRAVQILKRRGEISDVRVDGREIDLKYRSPLAASQAMRDARGVVAWVEAAAKLGGEALESIDRKAVAAFLARAFGVPEKLSLK